MKFVRFKIRALEELPKDKIYFVPQFLHCPNCGCRIGGTFGLGLLPFIPCKACGNVYELKDFAKQFGVIEGVEE